MQLTCLVALGLAVGTSASEVLRIAFHTPTGRKGVFFTDMSDETNIKTRVESYGVGNTVFVSVVRDGVAFSYSYTDTAKLIAEMELFYSDIPCPGHDFLHHVNLTCAEYKDNLRGSITETGGHEGCTTHPIQRLTPSMLDIKFNDDGTPLAFVNDDGDLDPIDSYTSLSESDDALFDGCTTGATSESDRHQKRRQLLSWVQEASTVLSGHPWCGPSSNYSGSPCPVGQTDKACYKHDHSGIFAKGLGVFPISSCEADKTMLDTVDDGVIETIFGSWGPMMVVGCLSYDEFEEQVCDGWGYWAKCHLHTTKKTVIRTGPWRYNEDYWPYGYVESQRKDDCADLPVLEELYCPEEKTRFTSQGAVNAECCLSV